MRLLDKAIQCKSRSDKFYLYAIGDTHIGARHTAENHLRRLVTHIQKTPNAYWIGGGDMCDCIKPQDIKRWDISILPDWMLEGNAQQTRDKLKDILQQQRDRLYSILDPIASKCIGIVEGNHEYSIAKNYNEDHHGKVCEHFGVQNLTDAAFVRLKFTLCGNTETVVLFICHGHGGGRAAGSEPTHLERLSKDKRANIIMRGHSHTFCVLPPVVELYIPTHGKLPDECRQTTKRAGNWGCWLRSWAVGDSTYESRACYPARPLSTLEVVITPHRHNATDTAELLMREYSA